MKDKDGNVIMYYDSDLQMDVITPVGFAQYMKDAAVFTYDERLTEDGTYVPIMSRLKAFHRYLGAMLQDNRFSRSGDEEDQLVWFLELERIFLPTHIHTDDVFPELDPVE